MNKIKICTISDTHGKHEQLDLPNADMIIHAGDFTNIGREYEIIAFMSWFSNLKYKYKLIIAGNHDWLFEKNKLLAKSLIPDNVIYLEDSGVNIENYYFYGSPVQKPFGNWAFNRPETKLSEHWKAIPDKTKVLITHSPPYGVGDFVPRSDNHEGSPSLFKEINNRVKPLVSIFGHIHEGYGINIVNNVTYINASVLNENYVMTNNPILFKIVDNDVNIINH